MACLTCGKIDNNELLQLNRIKEDYRNNGIVRYVYRLETNGTLFFVRENQFNDIFKNKIKKNIKKGAEYFHISEL